MKDNKILELIDSYWKFDDDQYPASSYHDKQDLLLAIEDELYAQLAAVRNKMSPIKNLIALVENFNVNLIAEETNVSKLFKVEIVKSKNVIKQICQTED